MGQQHIAIVEPLGGSAHIRSDTAFALGIVQNERLTQALWDEARIEDYRRNLADRKRA